MSHDQSVPAAETAAEPAAPKNDDVNPSWLTPTGKDKLTEHKKNHHPKAMENCGFCELVTEAVSAFARNFVDDEEKRKMTTRIQELEGQVASLRITETQDTNLTPEAFQNLRGERDTLTTEITRLRGIIGEAEATFNDKVREAASQIPHSHNADECLFCSKVQGMYDKALADVKVAIADHAGCAPLLASSRRENETLNESVNGLREEVSNWRTMYFDMKKVADDLSEGPKRKRPKGPAASTSANAARNDENTTHPMTPADAASSSAPTASTGGGGTAVTIPRNELGSSERPEPGVFRPWRWFEWTRYDVHHGSLYEPADGLIHGVVSIAKPNNKANTFEFTLRPEMIAWASTHDTIGRDAIAKTFGKPGIYTDLNEILSLEINPHGRLERRTFTMETKSEEIVRWFADHGLTINEGEEMFAWAKTYIDRRWMNPKAIGRASTPEDIRRLWERIKNVDIKTCKRLDAKWERKEPGGPSNHGEDTEMHSA